MDIPTAEIIKVVAALALAGGVGFGTNGMNSSKVDNALGIAQLAKEERDQMRKDYRADELQIVVNMRATCDKEKQAIEVMYNHPHE